MFEPNNPSLTSWVDVPPDSDFPIQNLPFGVFETARLDRRPATAIGDLVVDLRELAAAGLLDGTVPREVFDAPDLNPLIEQGKAGTRALRLRLSELLRSDNTSLRDAEQLRAKVLLPQADVTLCLPVSVPDYTDFYSSIEHATNVGTMFRDPDNALLPNWRHLPVAYHGRASSIIPSGQAIHRPKGQTKPPDSDAPVFGPCKLLDFELEMAFLTYPGKALGDSISTAEAENYIFGMVLFNDWSARDIQTWEYVPLGPFLAKNFASSISPWIVTLDALEPFRVAGPAQDPAVLPYLQFEGDKSYDINLEVLLDTGSGDENRVCQTNFSYMYWNMAQQLAHHTVNGCNVSAADMMGSGTISGQEPEMYGSMLELSWRGTKPLTMADGTERKFVQDGDTVIMRGHCEKQGVRVGFGEVRTLVLPAT